MLPDGIVNHMLGPCTYDALQPLTRHQSIHTSCVDKAGAIGSVTKAVDPIQLPRPGRIYLRREASASKMARAPCSALPTSDRSPLVGHWRRRSRRTSSRGPSCGPRATGRDRRPTMRAASKTRGRRIKRKRAFTPFFNVPVPRTGTTTLQLQVVNFNV